MNTTRFSLLVVMVLLAGCSGVFNSKRTIVGIVIRNEKGRTAGKPQADSLGWALEDLVKRWPAPLSKRQRLAVEKFIAKIDFSEPVNVFECAYKDPQWDPFSSSYLMKGLPSLDSVFKHKGEELSDRMFNELKVHRVNAELSLRNLLAEVDVQNWRMKTETEVIKAQFQNQCKLYERQMQVSMAAERSRMRQEALMAGAEVKACFPRVTRRVLK